LAMALHYAGHSPIVSLFRTIRLRVRGAIMRGLLYGGALAVACMSALLVVSARAHPGSGIVVDQKGQVFFQDIVGGAIWKIDERGKLSKYADVKGGHWLALDAAGKFSKATPKYYQRITLDGEKPALIHADGGAPLVVSSDGNLYYASGDKDDRPGGLALTRETPDGTRTSFSPALTKVLHQIDDGITGLASGPDGSLYVACWTAAIKVKLDGTVTTLAHPITVKDCDEDKADHKASSRLPLLRGLAVDSDGTVYAAATSCHCTIKITPEGQVETVLKAERPWSPTGVAIHGRDVYVLEFSNANGPATEGWRPRVRKLGRDGKVATLASISQEKKKSPQ
jgi:sugar lactone lactonase YvrE